MIARTRHGRAAVGGCSLLAIVAGMCLGGGFGALTWLAPAIATWCRAL